MIIYIQQRITTAQQPNMDGYHVNKGMVYIQYSKADPAAVEMIERSNSQAWQKSEGTESPGLTRTSFLDILPFSVGYITN